MPRFSQRSLSIVNTTKPALQRLAKRIVLTHDCTIDADGGLRTLERQKLLFDDGKSKTLDSKHLTGDAIHLIPYWPDAPHVRWPKDLHVENWWSHVDDTIEEWRVWAMFIGYVQATAQSMEINVRNGMRWSQDIYHEPEWIDAAHWELI